MTMQKAGRRPTDSVFATARRRHRRRRRRQWAMGFMSALTVFVLLLIAGFVKEISKTPTVARPAALTARAHATRHATSSPSARPKPSPSASPAGPQIADASSRLAYRLLASPWGHGCPGVLNTTMFSWTAGENAVAGQANIGGSTIDWHGIACSGQLGQQFVYTGPADLQPVAVGVTDAVEAAFYSGLRDYPTLEGSSAMQVSGHRAWAVTFLISYPDAGSEGLAWNTEAGAVVVVDRGPGQQPAVFYASVPSDLGTGTVTTLIGSLQLS